MNTPARNHLSRRNEESEGSNPGAAIAACLILAAVIAGGIWAIRSQKPSPKVAQFTGVDLNITVPQLSKAGWGVIDSIHDTVLPPQTPTKIWEFDLNPRTIWDGKPVSGRDLWPAEDIINSHPSRTRGTRPDLALKAMLPDIKAAADRGERVGIILVTDGDCTDPAALEKMAAEIAAIPAVRVLLCVGLESRSEVRNQYTTRLSPLGSKVICKGIVDAQAGVDEYRQKLLEGN